MTTSTTDGFLAGGIDQRVSAILKHISDAFQVIDADWRYVYLNDAARQMMANQGLDPEAFVGRHVWDDVFTQERDADWSHQLRRAAEEQRIVEFETYFPPWNRWYSVRVHPVAEGGVAVISQDVTEAKQAAQALQDSQARYRTLITSLDVGFCICEMILDDAGRAIDYRFLEINSAFVPLTGLPANAVGRTARELVPQIEQRSIDTYARVAFDGQPTRFENKSVVNQRHFEVFATPIGKRGQFALLFNDITARKEAESALRASEAEAQRQRRLYEAILGNTPDLAYVWDLNHRFIYVNEGLLRMWGKTWDEAIGKTCLQLGYEPWHAEMHDREIDHVAATRETYRGDVPFSGAFGRRIYEYILVPVIGADGRVEAVAGTTRDVTERKDSEQALRNHAEQFKALLDAAPIGVFLVDADFKIREVNPIAVPRFADIPGGAVDRNFADVMNLLREPDYAKRVIGIFRHTLETGESYVTVESPTNRLERPGDMYFEWRVDRITLPDGRFGLVCYFRDITSQVEITAEKEALLEREQAARSEAERAGRMKDEFLATLSHELRTPLNAILGYATLMRMASMSPAELEESAATIERNARVQAQLIEDLLDMNRIVSGKVRLTIEQLDLPHLVEESLKTVRPAAQAKGVLLRQIIEPLAGPVRGDPSRIQQIIWNLLSNAIKFTPKGGKVEISVRQVASSVEICVQDTGEGIPRAFLPFVFDRFRQADASTARVHGGLGLGLAIVRHLVELHGGTVAAASDGEGLGAVFTVLLPVAAVAKGGPSARQEQPVVALDHAMAAVDLTSVRVLVVDDEADATKLVERVLAGCNAHVVKASSADEAVRLLGAETFNVLVSDIGMPGADGYQLIKDIRGLQGPNRSIPAVALTAFARSEDRLRIALAGFQTHLAKPVEAAELVAVVASLAGRAGR